MRSTTLAAGRRLPTVIRAVFVGAAAIVCVTLATGSALHAQPRVILAPFATGFDKPMDIAHAGDGRLFVAEREGVIRVVESDGTVLPTPFLDVQDKVLCCSGGGLLGLTFHPNYLSNGFFYVDYTNNAGNIVVARYSVAGDPNVADPDSEVIVLEITHPLEAHNGGDLNFGPDGYLYISVGDGSGFFSVNGQRKTTLLGKILRIDVDSGSPYAIPPDNPFVSDAAALDEIWALGLRNPHRFSFDRATGDMYIGDVGENLWEEVDFQAANSSGGENYGWRCYEGNQDFNLTGCDATAVYTFPIHEYAHDPGCSVTGGFVYRGGRFGVLSGRYFFADYCSSEFWSLSPDGSGGWDLTSFGVPLPGLGPTTFGEDVHGELYVASVTNDTVYRIETSDYLKCYAVRDRSSPKFEKTDVSLSDELAVNDGEFEVKKPYVLCTPVDKDGEGISNPNDYLTCYKVKGPKLERSARPEITVVDPFGSHDLELRKASLLCVRGKTKAQP